MEVTAKVSDVQVRKALLLRAVQERHLRWPRSVGYFMGAMVEVTVEAEVVMAGVDMGEVDAEGADASEAACAAELMMDYIQA